MPKDDVYSKAYENWIKYDNYKSFYQMVYKTLLNVAFYQGDQRPRVTEKTKAIPQVIINVVQLVVDNKVSNILGTPIKLNYIADQNTEATDAFTKFSEYQLKEMDIEEVNRKIVKDAKVKGTGIWYFYWDERALGSRGQYKGALRCSSIDLLDFAVADPNEQDLQRQEYVLFRARENVDNVRSQCTNKKIKKLIQSDFQSNDTSYNNLNYDDQKVTVYNKFYRIDGNVYTSKSTRDYVIYEDRCLNPNVSRSMYKKLFDDLEDTDTPKVTNGEDEKLNVDTGIDKVQAKELDTESVSEYGSNQYKFYLYPFEVYTPKPKEKSFYGLSEVEPMIPTQKTINFVLGMSAVQIQNMAFGKWIAKKGTISKEISNIPGSIIEDNSRPGMPFSITQIPGQPLAGGIMEYVNLMIDLVRSTTNSSEIINGDMVANNLSAAAIQAMQGQAQKPIMEEQKTLWRCMQRIGKILEQFYKLFYENAEYSYQMNPQEVEMTPAYKEDIMNHAFREASTTKAALFNGLDYINIPFNVVVEAGQGSQYSELASMDMLNSLFLNGTINKMDSQQLELFLQLYPDKALPFKNDLMRLIKSQQESELGQAKQAIQQLQNTIKQYQAQMQQLGNQLKYYSNYTSQFEKSSKERISQLTSENDSMKKFMQNYYGNQRDQVVDSSSSLNPSTNGNKKSM